MRFAGLFSQALCVCSNAAKRDTWSKCSFPWRFPQSGADGAGSHQPARPVSSRRGRFFAKQDPAPGDPRARTWSVLLLSAPALAHFDVPRPRRAPRRVRPQFLAQPRFLLLGMQLPESGEARSGFSPLAVSRGPLDRSRTQRPTPRSRRACGRKACAFVSGSGKRGK